MNEKVKLILIAFFIGIIIGGGTATWIVGRNSARELAGYESALADWQRQLAARDRELAEARKLAEQRRAMDTEIMGAVDQGLGAIRAARSEYERTIAQFRLAQSVYETLRKYYDPGNKGQKNVNN